MERERKAKLTGEQRQVNWRRMLAAKPVRNQAAEVARQDDGLVRIAVRKRRPGFLVPPLAWIIRPRLSRRYYLDRLGTSVWELCDGQRTVEAVVDEFARRYRLSFHEARVAVTGYLRDLVHRGVLALVLAGKEIEP